MAPSLQEKTASVFNSQHMANKSMLTDPLTPGSRLGSLCVAHTPLERTAFPSLHMITHQDNPTDRSRILFASITVEGGNCENQYNMYSGKEHSHKIDLF